MKELDGPGGKTLTLLEEYDPEDETSENAVSRPWAFVCDYVCTLPTGKVSTESNESHSSGKAPETGRPSSRAAEKKRASEGAAQATASAIKSAALSLNVTEIIAQGPGSTSRAWEALADLRDKIADGERIDWWVIYNGDPERAYDDSEDYTEDDDMIEEQGEEVYEEQTPNQKTFVSQDQALKTSTAPEPTSRVSRVNERDMPPPPLLKDKSKRAPETKAPPQTQRAAPPPTVPTGKSASKADSGKKKFFSRK